METIIEAHGTYTIIRVDASDGRSYRIAGQCWSFRRLRNARRRAKALARMEETGPAHMYGEYCECEECTA